MLHDHVVALVIVRHLQLVQERVPRLPYNHCTEELTAEPTTAPWCHILLHNCDFYPGMFSELVSA